MCKDCQFSNHIEKRITNLWCQLNYIPQDHDPDDRLRAVKIVAKMAKEHAKLVQALQQAEYDMKCILDDAENSIRTTGQPHDEISND